jgi:N-methylhydantoinase B
MDNTRDTRHAIELSPGDIEVTWDRLLALMDEAAATMIRTAYSITIRESKDLAVVLFDRQGRALAESAIASPSFIGTLPRTLDAFLSTHPASEWCDGDLVVTNDPWIGSGHLQDITMAAPILLGAELLGFIAISAHGPDIGGSLYSAMSREIFEEGLRIPICHYARAGHRDGLVQSFITANVRVPEKVIGDLEGMAACCTTASHQVVRLVREIGIGRYHRIGDEIVERSATAISAAVAKVANGSYTSSVTTSGFDSHLEICCRVTIEDERIEVDYAGTSASQPLGINVPYCYTYAHTLYPLKCIFGAAIPNNHGTATPFTVTAPEGSILNPAYPAAVNARHLTGQFLSAAVLLALAEALPDRVIAESGVPRPQVVFSGETSAGSRFVEHIFLSSGVGAGDGQDGPHALCYPTNTSNTPVEIMESLTPLLIERKEIRSGSGGAGTYRGGCGQRFVVRNTGDTPIRISILADMTHRGARGIFGGEPGRCAVFTLDARSIDDKVVLDMSPGSVLEIDAAGGGGFGAPARRAAEAVAADIDGGYIEQKHQSPATT